MKAVQFFISGGLILSLLGCKKLLPCKGDDMPDYLRFVLLDKQGRNLLKSISTPLTVWTYNQQGQRFTVYAYTSDFQAIRAYDSTAVFPYRLYYKDLATSVSSDQGSKDFYLELNGKTDTLHYDVRLARPDDCFNRYDVVETRFNGELLAPRAMPGGLPYYVLQRRH